MPGFDEIFTRIRNLLTFGNQKENTSLKRRCDEHLQNSPLLKYRKVSNDFPKYIHKPDDDITFVRPERLTFRRSKRPKFLMDSTAKSKSSSSNTPAYADFEFSDDEDDVIFKGHHTPLATSSTSKSTYGSKRIIGGNTYSTTSPIDYAQYKPKVTNIPIILTNRDRKSVPPLIDSKTGILTNCIPNLHPIHKSTQNFPGFSNGLKKPENAFANNSEKLFTNGFGTTKNTFCAKSPNSLIAKTFNMQEKESYLDLLTKLVPTLYKPSMLTRDRERLALLRNSQGASNARRESTTNRYTPKVGPVINLIEDDEQIPKEFIDLSEDDIQIISACRKTMTENKKTEAAKKELPHVDPVNSLKDTTPTSPTLLPEWLDRFKENYTSKKLIREKQISEEEENVRKLSAETEHHERLIERRLKNFMIHSETIILDESESEEEEEFPEFTNDEKDLIKKSIYRGSADEILVSKFNISITRRDINTLVGDSWLNDEVINFYMNLLMERGDTRHSEGLPRVYAMNTFFIPRLMQSGHSGVRRWTRKVDIFAYDVIPVPVHVGGVHWCMAIIHIKNQTIKYYDSMGTPNPRVLQALEQYLKDESVDKKGETFDTRKFRKESVPDVPRQMNGSDCGVFSCMFAEYITRNHEITFSQQHMQYFRQKMILEIVKGKLLL